MRLHATTSHTLLYTTYYVVLYIIMYSIMIYTVQHFAQLYYTSGSSVLPRPTIQHYIHTTLVYIIILLLRVNI